MQQWILAFDSNCPSCSDVAARVRDAAGDRVELAGLDDPRIHELRSRALGEHPRWAPTLLAVEGDGERVRAWTGSRLSARMVRLLGPARSLRVVRNLSRAHLLAGGDGAGADRRRLLKAAPAVAAGAFLVSGGLSAPAVGASRTSAGTSSCVAARKWVKANKGHLPTQYKDVASYPMAYRRAIFQELDPETRHRLLVDHLRHYRKTHPGLNAKQLRVIGKAEDTFKRVFATGSRRASRAELDDLRDAAIREFGGGEAGALLATLGPPEPQEAKTKGAGAKAVSCSCASYSDYCGEGTHCNGVAAFGDCERTNPGAFGCGTGLTYGCDGLCQPNP